MVRLAAIEQQLDLAGGGVEVGAGPAPLPRNCVVAQLQSAPGIT